MENLRHLVFRWRLAVLALELSIAVAFAVTGWRLVHGPTPPLPVAVRSPQPHPQVPPRYAITMPFPRADAGAAPSLALPGFLTLSPALIRRLNAADFALYHNQQRAFGVMSEGIRRYLERWVLPRLFDPGLRG